MVDGFVFSLRGLSARDFTPKKNQLYPICAAGSDTFAVGVSHYAPQAGPLRDTVVARWHAESSIAAWDWDGIEVRQRPPTTNMAWNISAYRDGKIASVCWEGAGAPPIEDARPLITHLLSDQMAP